MMCVSLYECEHSEDRELNGPCRNRNPIMICVAVNQMIYDATLSLSPSLSISLSLSLSLPRSLPHHLPPLPLLSPHLPPLSLSLSPSLSFSLSLSLPPSLSLSSLSHSS